MRPVLKYLKVTEVGDRAGATEREREWQRKNDPEGEDQLSDVKNERFKTQEGNPKGHK